MKVFITSCGRYDLLKITLRSFTKHQRHLHSGIVIHEDSKDIDGNDFETLGELKHEFQFELFGTDGIGQHASIEKFLKGNAGKYAVMLEDDWRFENSYDWIEESIKIMEADPSIIKVLCRKDSPHPCVHDHELMDHQSVCKFGYLQPWENNGILWHGFSFNPGVTRLDLLREFVPFGKHEQDLAKAIYDKGYKVVELERGVYTHVGEGRSTHA